MSRIDWDETKLPRTTNEWQQFLKSIASHDDYETEWLEQKSQGNPMKGADLGKLAKCILGMANRDPQIAAKYIAGHGLMVWGIDNGQMIGISPMEDHQLQDKLRPYLTDDGPYWRGIRIPTDSPDRHILIIDVDPPVFGHPVFLCCKNGDGVADGGIYVRDKTQTRSATSQEIRRLQSRSVLPVPALDIDVSIASPLKRIDRELVGADSFLAAIENRLLAAMPPEPSKPSSPSTVKHGLSTSLDSANSIRRLAALSIPTFSAYASTIPEDRTRDEYRATIAVWKQKAKNAFPLAIDEYIGSALPDARFKITNNSAKFLKKVQVKIHIEGDIEYQQKSTKKFRLLSYLPRMPRKWGPRENELGLSASVLRSATLGPTTPYVPRLVGPDSIEFKNGGSVDVTIDVSDLRPGESYVTPEDEAVLVLPKDYDDSVHATWTLTAMDYDGIVSGEFSTPVSGDFPVAEMLA